MKVVVGVRESSGARIVPPGGDEWKSDVAHESNAAEMVQVL